MKKMTLEALSFWTYLLPRIIMLNSKEKVFDYKMKKRWPYSKENGSNEKSAYWDSENVLAD
jgi:hypothetical protein